MIVEFFGLPGAGKTTLAKKTAEIGDFRIIKIRNKGELIFLNLVYFLKHPIRFFVTFFYLVKNSSTWAAFYYKFLNTFLHHNAKYQKALKLDRAILDQGYFQNLLSVFEKPISERFLKKYAKYLLSPDRLIILRLPFSESLARLEKRGYAPRQSLDDPARQKWIEAVKSNYELFLKASDQLSLDSLIVDSSQNVDDVVKNIINFIG